jgi:hypothetical protein
MADEDKLVKAGVEAALKPFADLLEKLAGPAAEEIGLTLKDHVHAFRLRRQLRLFSRVTEMLQTARIEPQHVPLKFLSPVIENSSIEEDDSLQDKWAALFANAAKKDSVIHPAYIETLRQLSSMDVVLLDVLFEIRLTGENQIYRSEAAKQLGRRLIDNYDHDYDSKRAEKLLVERAADDNLARLGLITVEAVSEGPTWYTITRFGNRFCVACRPPRH